MKTNLTILWIAVFALCFGARVSHAGPVGPLTTFTSGTPALASEVNGNFSTVKSAVDNHDSRITQMETNITLVPSTATAGNILKGTFPFIHNFGLNNTFIGVGAGNFAMTGAGNTGGGRFALSSVTSGTDNTAVGMSALESNTSGGSNVAIGVTALFSNTTGSSNTASGTGALHDNTTGNSNTAIGASALGGNTTGSGNTATGASALQANTTGTGNTAAGASALGHNTTGTNNTAAGGGALLSNTTGGFNTAFGFDALLFNTTGTNNTAVGVSALFNNTGTGNTAIGLGALQSNTGGGQSTAVGAGALGSNTTGVNNTAHGFGALGGNTTGSNNIALGMSAGQNVTTGSGNIYIGNGGGITTEADTIRMGGVTHARAFIAGIRGKTTGVADAVAVVIDSTGQLGTISSSRRVKDDIADMGKASGALMKLRPVTFHYKNDNNPKGRTLQYGLVAEEVAKVAPGLVAHSADGKIETVYYQFLAPMLLNEVQKQQRTIDTQTARIAELEQDRQTQASELRKQSAEIAELRQQAGRMAGLLERLEQAGMLAVAVQQ